MARNGLAINLKHNLLSREEVWMITILFFAQLQEEIGPTLQFDCAQCTVQEVKNYVLQSYPHVYLDSVMVAINEQFASGDAVVKAGDVVAFLPPVSGG